MIKGLVLLISVMIFSQAHASNEKFCPDERVDIGEAVVERGYFESSDSCYVSVRESWPRTYPIYRSYMFTSKGLMMIFSSFGDGPSSRDTGASEFFFFPIRQNPTYEIEGKTIWITDAAGNRFEFDANTAQVVSMDKGQIYADASITRENGGGIKVLSYDGLRLEAGFQLGMSPTWYLGRSSTFFDGSGKKCTIKNSSFFDKKGDEVVLRYIADSSIRTYLRRSCSTLEF